jgi:hypothetical protein
MDSEIKVGDTFLFPFSGGFGMRAPHILVFRLIPPIV